MKIHITGNAGSGKTTFAKQLSEAIDIPVYGLDKIVWQAGWGKTPVEERKKLETALVEKEEWIIEGVSSIARQASDITIFLDIPRYICFYQGLNRSARYLFKSRPELPDNCPEILIIPQLLKLIWSFPILVRPTILDDLNMKFDKHVNSKEEMLSLVYNTDWSTN